LLPLRELQLRFVAALYESSDAVIAGALADGAPSPAARLGVYRNNLREGFIGALALGYPVVEKLVGDAFFRQTARDFQLLHPSRSGDLSDAGALFPGYLRARYADGDLAWLPDVAELEWALECVATAPAVGAIDPASLARMPADRYEDLVFAPNPATRLVESRYPIVRIWQTNQPGAPTEQVDLDAGAEHLLVRRHRGEFQFVRLSPADFTFARMLSRGTTLGLATDASLAIDVDFDLARALRTLIQAGAFARIALDD
jgi:hypothetical protein